MQKGAEARCGAPSLCRGAAAQLSGPPPGCQHASAPKCVGGTEASRGSRKRFVFPHLDLDSTRYETAFPVSRETVLHVGLTLGRSDVTAYASRQRGSRAPLPCPRPQCPAEAGKRVAGSQERARITRGVL